MIGLPKNMDGTLGERAEASQKYGELVVDKFGYRLNMKMNV